MWDIAAIDEVHTFRNDECDQTHAISKLTETAALRIGLTGTMIFNHPRDMRGQALALNVPDNFMDRSKWVLDRAGRRVRPESVREFHAKFVHRARATELNLPETVHEAVTYAVQLPPDAVPTYEQGRQSACNLRMQMQRSGRVDAQQLRQLMAMIGGLQQFLVSPRLAEYSAPDFEANAALYDEAGAEPTGAFYALQDELLRMRDEGHRKIVVSCCHVQMMEIVARWLRRTAPELGEIVVYKGKLSRPQRLKVKKTFLRPGAEGVLFLSVGAGGTGLHLVPAPEGMIFWGSSPFAPARVEQTSCRINRIGQTCPLTGKVTVRHLVPYGGVDYAIRRTHRDKRKLMDMCQENEWAPGDEHNGEWRRAGQSSTTVCRSTPTAIFRKCPHSASTPSRPRLERLARLARVTSRRRWSSTCRHATTANRATWPPSGRRGPLPRARAARVARKRRDRAARTPWHRRPRRRGAVWRWSFGARLGWRRVPLSNF